MNKRGVSPSNRFGGTASTDGFILSPKRGENVRILCGYYQDKYQVLVSARKKKTATQSLWLLFFSVAWGVNRFGKKGKPKQEWPTIVYHPAWGCWKKGEKRQPQLTPSVYHSYLEDMLGKNENNVSVLWRSANKRCYRGTQALIDRYQPSHHSRVKYSTRRWTG